MNAEGLTLLRAVVERTAGLNGAVKKGDCKAIAAEVNGWMPEGMKVSEADVYYAMKDRPEFKGPARNAEVLRARIDKMPTLFSARINCALAGDAGVGARQAIMNECNLSPDPAQHVTFEDVEAAMALRVAPSPEKPAAGAADLVGKGASG